MLKRLGVVTDEVSSDLTEALDWVADQGLSHVEIRMVNGKNVVHLTDHEIAWVYEAVVKRGLFVSTIASPLFKCALDPSRPVASGDRFGQPEEDIATHFAMLHRTIQIANMLQTRNIRLFSFWREREPRRYQAEIVGHLRQAAAIAEQERMLLLLENEPSCNGGYAEEVASLVEEVDSPALRVLWDPGNEEYGGRPAFPEGYRWVKDWLGHVHLKDALVDDHGKPQCVPIGLGRVRMLEQLQALEADGYKGYYTIETHYIPPGGTAKDGTQQSLRGLQKLLKEAEWL
ncbi:sugar phosphate isomerase/epimerase family protein [Laceyella sacchari]|uniref:Sugar phosphate isomerase/epimerase n=1 Tax=Laceyella sacchari TaxID=37482 RepID=A0ABY5U020_LACSH|nr:sugar phosphate isomerase/epimerase family protein [Laceyella sacchari]UWE02380.1 sugar phosphate isomerase/epimerase [Laceyella sacchari]